MKTAGSLPTVDGALAVHRGASYQLATISVSPTTRTEVDFGKALWTLPTSAPKTARPTKSWSHPNR